MNPYLILAMAGAGLALVVTLVAAIARHLVYAHADAYAAAVRAAAARHQVAEHQAAVERIKESIR